MQNNPIFGVVGPLHCYNEKDQNGNEKYYTIYPYVDGSELDKLFNFIHYSDWNDAKPSNIRKFEEKRKIWENLVEQLIEILKKLYERKLAHGDLRIKENILFSINKQTNTLSASIINFDNAFEHSSEDKRINNIDIYDVICLFEKFIIPIFRGGNWGETKFGKKYYLEDINKKLPQEQRNYFKWINQHIKNLIPRLAKINIDSIEIYEKCIDDFKRLLLEPKLTLGETIYKSV